MAMKPSTESIKLLDRRFAPLAGNVSIVLGILAAAALIIRMFTREAGWDRVMAVLVGWTVVMFVVVGVSVQLWRGRTWAQRFLLVFWLLVSVVSGVLALYAALWETPGWWDTSWPLATVTSLVLVAGLAASVLLLMASPESGRLRYGSMVAVSLAVAVVLVIVVNMIFQAVYWRKNVEAIGRYGLSDRSKKIFGATDSAIRLTCVYTSTEEGKEGSKFRGKAMELLEEIQELDDDIQIENVRNDAQKAEVIARLRARAGGKAGEHVECLEDFRRRSDEILQHFRLEMQSWSQMPQTSFLALWGLPAQMQSMLRDDIRKVEEVARKVRSTLGGSALPDYASLVDDVKSAIKDPRDQLENAADLLERLGKIPAAVAASRQGALQEAEESIKAAKKMVQVIGAPEDPPPKDPKAVLDRFAETAEETAKLTVAAAEALEGVAGEENKAVINNSRDWVIGRTELTEFYLVVQAKVANWRLQAKTYTERLVTDEQLKLVLYLRTEAPKAVGWLAEAKTAADRATKGLATVDEPTKKILERASGGQFFQRLLGPLGDLLDKIEKLPELKGGTLATEITGENIIVVEAAGKAEVVEFAEVFPLAVPRMGPAPAESEAAKKRRFNGDSAVASTVLSMTQKPFAKVLLTHFEARVPPQMARMVPPPDIGPRNLNGLRRRLEQANFKVEDWNLVDPMPGEDDDKDDDKDSGEETKLPRVLLVLPPPQAPMPPMMGRQPQMPRFEAEHLAKVRDAIDSGVPAIFLTQFFRPRQMSFFMPPTQPPYEFAKYLEEDWGILAKTDHWVISTVRNENGQLNIDPLTLRHLGVSTFTDHKIGRPLQARRVLWQDLCPVQAAETLPEGVTVEPLLSLPANWQTTWATPRIVELAEQFQATKGTVALSEEAGDMAVPFDVAVAGKRAGQKEARIVVLGVGASMTDGYLDAPVAEMHPNRGMTLADPPRANADLVINSVYWLVGHEQYIASGPAQVKPISLISAGTLTFLKFLCLAVLPLLVLALGGVVLFTRRR